MRAPSSRNARAARLSRTRSSASAPSASEAMAIDGTPPFKLPPGAQRILLNDFDILTITQFAVSGAGPYTVPSGRRLIITGAAISFVELSGTVSGGRDFLIQADL